MKKHLMIFAAVVMALAIAMPAFADVEFKYGGNFRARWFIQDNLYDGTSKKFSTGYDSVDNRRIVDQRVRLYFTFQGSKNLKLVTAYEFGTAIWGQGNNASGTTASNTGANLGANLGGDSISIEVKNAYIDFAIPNTPTKAIIGLQPIDMLNSWVLSDDFPAAVLVTKLDPFTVTVGYVGGQNGWERATSSTSRLSTTDDTYNIDDFLLSFDYKSGPFKASLIGLLQFGHDSMASIDPSTFSTPIRSATGNSTSFLNQPTVSTASYQAQNNFLIDLGLNLTYKTDWLLAYVNFVKNVGGADIVLTPGSTGYNRSVDSNKSVDYTGWMIDAGVTYFCGPWTANIGGFYVTGPDYADTLSSFQSGTYADGTRKPFKYLQSSDVNWFTYPMGIMKSTSEIIGGGLLGEDLHTVRGYSTTTTADKIGQGSSPTTVMWRGWYEPMNLWTITAGGSYQFTPTTKLSLSYWYWGTSSAVPVALYTTGANAGKLEKSSDVGHEFNLYLDQKIYDGFTLTLVGAYLVAGDAFAPIPTTIAANGSPLSVNSATGKTNLLAENAFEIGARLMWNF